MRHSKHGDMCRATPCGNASIAEILCRRVGAAIEAVRSRAPRRRLGYRAVPAPIAALAFGFVKRSLAFRMAACVADAGNGAVVFYGYIKRTRAQRRQMASNRSSVRRYSSRRGQRVS